MLLVWVAMKRHAAGKKSVFCLKREAIRRCVVASELVEMTPLSARLFSAVRWHSQSRHASRSGTDLPRTLVPDALPPRSCQSPWVTPLAVLRGRANEGWLIAKALTDFVNDETMFRIPIEPDHKIASESPNNRYR